MWDDTKNQVRVADDLKIEAVVAAYSALPNVITFEIFFRLYGPVPEVF
jgi:hypothetical protein